MRKHSVALALILSTFLGSNLSAEPLGVLEIHGQYASEEWVPTVNLLASGTFDEESIWGAQAFMALVPVWGQAYAGPSLTPTDWLSLSLMAGVQIGDDAFAPRYAASSFWSANDRLSGVVWFEFDHEGIDTFWYHFGASYELHDAVSVGILARRTVGVGPSLSFSIPNTPLGVWLSWTPVGFEEPTDVARSSFALTYTF